MPLVSIVILTYNRINVLIDIIQKLKQLTYKNVEIIIINNNSNDDTKVKLTKLFPYIKLINLEKNIGVSALNYGLKEAKGEYVLQLDDDSYPKDVDIIEKAIRHFETDCFLAVLAFRIENLRFNFCETREFDKTLNHFVGCGVMFRNSHLKKSSYYNPYIYIYYNEFDLTAKLLNLGYKIRYDNSLVVFHLQTPSGRVSDSELKKSFAEFYKTPFRFYHNFLSRSVFLLNNFSLKFIVMYLPKLIIGNLIIALRFVYLKEFFLALFHIICYLRILFKDRNIINMNVQRLFGFGNIALIDRGFFDNFRKGKFTTWLK